MKSSHWSVDARFEILNNAGLGELTDPRRIEDDDVGCIRLLRPQQDFLLMGLIVWIALDLDRDPFLLFVVVAERLDRVDPGVGNHDHPDRVLGRSAPREESWGTGEGSHSGCSGASRCSLED
jgi:hypothetical protein